MPEKSKEELISWLNDAYAMEKEAEEILQHRIDDVKDMPLVKGRIEQHLEETKDQAERVKTRIEALGGQISKVKSGLYNLMGIFSGRSTGPFSDEMVKNGIADYTTESMEIASYNALIAGAKELGDVETMKIAEENLREEQSMAQWLKEQMPYTVKQYLTGQGA